MRGDADAHAAAQHHHHAFAGRADQKDRFSRRVGTQPDAREQHVPFGTVEGAKQHAVLEQPTGAVQQVAFV
jgi:hypothetical protein